MIARNQTFKAKVAAGTKDTDPPVSVNFIRSVRSDTYCRSVIKLAYKLEQSAQLGEFIKVKRFEDFVPEGLDEPVFLFEVTVGDEKWR